jgi:hypothetical protein
MSGPMPGMPSGPIGGFPSQPAGAAPSGPIGGFPSQPVGAVPVLGPIGPIVSMPGTGSEPPEPTGPAMPPPSPISLGMMPTSLAALAVRLPQGNTIACPRCGTQTPLGFAYCQQCGLQLPLQTPADPGANARPRGPSAAPASLGGKLDELIYPTAEAPRGVAKAAGVPSRDAASPIDPHAGTLAQDDLQLGSLAPGARPAAAAAPRAQPLLESTVRPGPSWGTAVLVNRDGSDGQHYPLVGEYLVVGRAGADIAFDEDRFLARQHARIERSGDGIVKIDPLDTLNGVFRKADAPVELVDGLTILVGREVLRYERVDPEEIKVHPLVRHGVALFGSPPREPWGRLVQLIPSGGYRDVRHLVGEEVVLGREEGDLLFRDDAFMSRRHAAVTWDGKRAQITDLGSSNGTFVRITGPTPLRHGDHVRLGDQLLRIELGR